MMRCFSFVISLFVVIASHAQEIADVKYLEKVLNTLASDEVKGRSALRPDDIEKATVFIENEFKTIGLQPYQGADGFRQKFELTKFRKTDLSVTIDGESKDAKQMLVFGTPDNINWSAKDGIPSSQIGEKDEFSAHFREIAQNETGNEIIWVHSAHAAMLGRYRSMLGEEGIGAGEMAGQEAKVFVVSDVVPKDFVIAAGTVKDAVPMNNVVGVLPGKAKPDEYVIFSAHYDHIGVLEAVETDSIANGADDDASGVSAVLALAKYFKKTGQNERTLLFVTFTGEELGLKGSEYFATQINPDQVVAMVNIEMIGKDSKFGPNSLYVTGHDASNLAELMQANVKETPFVFHPDPYPKQNLFYRSDNASLAAVGVPAHTFATVQIDQDGYYHTVKDEVSTLNIENIRYSVEAIARGVSGIIDGTQTPTRVEKLR